MLVVQNPQDLKEHIGEEVGVSEWVLVDQDMIDKFAEATGDHQWIHVDVERCKNEMPDGKTIAHGYLTLSLLPRLSYKLTKVENSSRGINYGSNKVRFTSMVPSGSRVRLRSTLKAVDDIPGGVKITNAVQMEREGAERPVMVAETISLSYE